MNIKRFKEEMPNLILTSSNDNAFSALRVAIHGMAGIRTAKIINFAARCMEKDEFYVEVGTFSGFTLISAGYQSNALCVGVDDFSLEEVIKPESRDTARVAVNSILQKNLGEFAAVNCRFVNSDFRKVSFPESSKGKLAVLFIDGNHNYQDVKETMETFSPYLSPQAVLIFDDIQFGGVDKYISELWSKGNYEMLLYVVNTVNDHDERIHLNMPLNEYIANGVCVMTRKENVSNS